VVETLHATIVIVVAVKFSVACSKTLDEKIKYQSAGGRTDKKINCRDLLEHKNRGS
jgi:hypothetical protein